MSLEAMPADWIPTTRDSVRFGRLCRMWTYKGHGMAYRGETAAEWDAWRAEVWAAKLIIDGGATVAHAHDNRHDPATRPVSAPQRLNLEDDT